jgi:hypothetical protein
VSSARVSRGNGAMSASGELPVALVARCGATRESSARLRDHAQALCALSADLRSTQRRRPVPRSAVTTPPATRCVGCGEVVPLGERARAVTQPIHAACRERQLQDLTRSLVELIAAVARPRCRRCLAGQLGVSLPQLYVVTGRLLFRRLVRTAAAPCGSCGLPRLVMVGSVPGSLEEPRVTAGQPDAALLS